MSISDILAIVTSPAANEHVIAFAEQLTAQSTGRLTTALVNWMPNVAPVEGYVLDPFYGDLVKDAEKQSEEQRADLVRRLDKGTSRSAVEPYLIEFAAAGAALGLRARHADVSIVARPGDADGSSAHAILEAALFGSGRPVVIVPPSWKNGPIGRNVLVAWKPTREAARALGDAGDFLQQAERVSVATVDAKPSRGYGEQPGADITSHLARRGVKAELFNLDSTGRSETRAILDQALAVGADLVVMGGYGRARLTELIFGGVTRGILKSAEVPVLMSH
jgi:nucleotide-binding universal stress UspA family protein